MEPVTISTASPSLVSARRLPHHAGFWIIAVAFLTEMAFCAIPTPLYAIYQQRDGFPTIVLTVIFVAYAVGVMVSLYLAGHVSDWLGRRRVILGSLLINVLSAVLFLVWTDVTGLIVARFVCGLGVGILTATATAHLSELGTAAGRSGGRSSLVSTFANLGGISLGPLVGGVVATWAARPLVTPYAIFAIGAAPPAGRAVVVPSGPEPGQRREPRPAYRPQRVAIPAEGRAAFWSAAAAAFGAFAVFGTFMGLSSTFLGRVLGVHSPLLVGVAPFILFMAAAAAQMLTTTVPARAQLISAIALAVLGLATVSAGAVLTSLALFLIGGASRAPVSGSCSAMR